MDARAIGWDVGFSGRKETFDSSWARQFAKGSMETSDETATPGASILVRYKEATERKSLLLGMPYGTANARLRKSVMFHLVQKLKLDDCFRCGQQIETVDELSLEHPEPWQSADDPVKAFFDLENIAFSHHLCNIRAASKPHKLNLTPAERAKRKRELYGAKLNTSRRERRARKRAQGISKPN